MKKDMISVTAGYLEYIAVYSNQRNIYLDFDVLVFNIYLFD
jgi:hypothetical protein